MSLRAGRARYPKPPYVFAELEYADFGDVLDWLLINLRGMPSRLEA
jgi:hypothetical protein